MKNRVESMMVAANAAAGVMSDRSPGLGGILTNATMMRSALISKLLDDRRDIDQECGYPKEITTDQYRLLYDREGIATRAVALFPEESWSMDPLVFETEKPEETEFEKTWEEIQKKLNLYARLLQVDEVSGIGRFGVLLLGFDDGQDLAKPLESVGVNGEKVGEAAHKLLYVRAFDESVLKIVLKETDSKNPRYGKPVLYNINMEGVTATSSSGQAVTSGTSQKVHWTRVIHVADNLKTSEVYGVPRMQNLYNRLYDLRKLSGGSGEMFWKGAFPGITFEVNPDAGVTLTDDDRTSLREEFEAYSNGLQRYLALENVKATSMLPQAVDPRGHVDVQLELIAIALGIPRRILEGSERGELASNQDTKTWNKRIDSRRRKYVGPMILRPFIDRLIAVGTLPEPTEYFVDWPDLNAPGEQEMAEISHKRVEAIVKYIQGGMDTLVPPKEFLTIFMGMSLEETDAIMKAALSQISEEEGGSVLKQQRVQDEEASAARAAEEAEAAGAAAAAVAAGGAGE